MKNKGFYQYFGIYYVVSVLTLIITSGTGGQHTWDTLATYQLPLFSPLYFLFTLGIMFSDKVVFLVGVVVVAGLSGTIYFLKKNTSTSKVLSYICWVLFSIGITILAIIAATI